MDHVLSCRRGKASCCLRICVRTKVFVEECACMCVKCLNLRVGAVGRGWWGGGFSWVIECLIPSKAAHAVRFSHNLPIITHSQHQTHIHTKLC